MKRPQADYSAVEATLRPHQLQTLADIALARGSSPQQMWHDTVVCSVAVSLAVCQLISQLVDKGMSHRQAIRRTAAVLDLDHDTLSRRQRRERRRRLVDKVSGQSGLLAPRTDLL